MSKPTLPSPKGPRRSRSLGACILSALLFGVLLCILALMFFAWVLSMADLPVYTAVPLSTSAVCIGTAGAAMALSRMQQKNGLLLGAGTGLFFFAAYAAAALLNGQREFTGFAAIKLLCILLAGCLGGYLGLLSSERKTHRRPAIH